MPSIYVEDGSHLELSQVTIDRYFTSRNLPIVPSIHALCDWLRVYGTASEYYQALLASLGASNTERNNNMHANERLLLKLIYFFPRLTPDELFVHFSKKSNAPKVDFDIAINSLYANNKVHKDRRGDLPTRIYYTNLKWGDF